MLKSTFFKFIKDVKKCTSFVVQMSKKNFFLINLIKQRERVEFTNDHQTLMCIIMTHINVLS